MSEVVCFYRFVRAEMVMVCYTCCSAKEDEDASSCTLIMERIRLILMQFARSKTVFFALPMLALVFLVVPEFAFAVDFGQLVLDGITLTVSWLVKDLYIPLIGFISTLLMELVVRIAMYNSFGTATAVTIGWVLIRDITNMMLVVILLSMAFGTLLNQGGKLGDYKSLPKFALIAIVINFSKMITLLMIDISQVVMLSFVAAFQNTAAGNFIKAFGIKDWFTLDNFGSNSNTADFNLMVLIGLALAAILVTVTMVVLLVLVVYLILRVVMLWILIIFAPLAFGLNLLPSRGKAYYDQWWEHLLSTLITGPLLAFFLWLTLIVAGASNGAIGSEILADSQQLTAAHNAELGAVIGKVSMKNGSAALTPDTIVTFLLTTLMLVLGLKISIEMGGVVGSAAGRIGKGLPMRALRYGKKTVGLGWKTTKGTVGLLGKAPAIFGAATLQERAKVRAQQIRESRFGQIVGLDKDHTERRSKERTARYLRSVGKETDARQLEQQIISGDREKMKGLTQKQLVAKMKSADSGSLEHQAVARELAKTGYFRSRLGDVDIVAGGNEQFKKDLLSEDSQLNYVDTTGKTPEQAVVDKTASMSKGDLQKFYATIDVDVQRSRNMAGEVVETANPVGAAKLSTLTRDTYDDLNAVNKKKVQKALLTRMRNASNPAEITSLRTQFRTLTGQNIMLNADRSVMSAQDASTGAAVAGDRLQELQKMSQEGISQQQKNLSEEAIKGARAEKLEASPQDRVLRNAQKNMSVPARSDVTSSLRTVQRVVSGAVNRGDYDAARNDLQFHRGRILSRYEAMDAAGESTGHTNADGTALTHRAAFDESSLGQSMANMLQALDRRRGMGAAGASATEMASQDQIIRELQREIDAHSAGVMGDSPGRVRRNRDVARKMLKEDVNALSARMTSARSAGSASDQQKAIKKAADMMKTVIARIQESNTAAGMDPEINALMQRVQDHIDQRAGKSNADLMTELNALNAQITAMKDRVK